MRHIPEEELHAYLDQALSRSQCVEIESHLAACPSCRATRDGIAALRDRTTALLARLAPRRAVPPPFESLRHLAASQLSARRRRMQRAVWAASLVAAVGLGWSAASVLGPPARSSEILRSRPTPAPSTALGTAAAPTAAAPTRGAPPSARPVTRVEDTPSAVSSARPPRDARNPTRPARRALGTAPVTVAKFSADSPAEETPPPSPLIDEPSAIEFSSLDSLRPQLDLDLDGVWRTMSWDGAQAEAGNDLLPRIGGLPVVEVQVQTAGQGKRPLMVVAQQLASGAVIRTIEGPTTDVSHLLAHRAMSDPDPAGASPGRPPGAQGGTDHTMAMQRGDRLLVITGALPSDSLRAMIRRLNAEMRSK